MRILITEQRPGAATEVAQRLGAVGNTLTYCHSPEPDDARGRRLRSQSLAVPLVLSRACSLASFASAASAT